jgi:hypothetical protein
MERVKWTDDLIDERMAAIDEKFDRQFEETRALREEVRSGFSELRAEMRALHQRMDTGFSTEHQRMDTGFSEQHHEMLALQRQLLFIVAGFVVALIGLLGAAVAQL